MQKQVLLAGVGGFIVGGCVVGAAIHFRRTPFPKQEAPAPVIAESPSAAESGSAAAPQLEPEATPAEQPEPMYVAPSPPPAPAPTAPRANEVLKIARQAMALVGRDQQAEVVWLAAINNRDLAPNDRKDLIEDLKDTGFNEKDPTADDLQVVSYRINLIERLGPQAMDETNAAAFEKAYKKLTKLRARATGG